MAPTAPPGMAGARRSAGATEPSASGGLQDGDSRRPGHGGPDDRAVKSMVRSATLAAMGSVLLPAISPAQTGRLASFDLGLARSWEETEMGATLVSRSGLLLEGAGRLSVSVLALDAVYRQGSLSAAGGGDQRDVVEGQIALGLQLVPWLAVQAGPRLRAYVTPAGTERWVFWEGNVRASARVIRPDGWAYLRVGRVLTANLPGLTWDGGQGAEGGLKLRLVGPLWGSVSYWIHRAATGGGQRVETIQGVSAGLALAP